MGGHSGGGTAYEPERIGVNKRRYGELADNGFQSIDAYKAAIDVVDNYNPNLQQYDSITTNSRGEDPSDATTTRVENAEWRAQQDAMEAAGLTYNKDFDRWTLANGVDFEAAKEDWGNYQMEREDIAKYNANEARRLQTPGDLAGTSGATATTLAIDLEDDENTTVGTSDALSITSDYPSTASTSQVLGIY